MQGNIKACAVPLQSQELISVGNAQRSLENICGWSYLQHREQTHAEQHDHTIYLSRQEFGPPGMQGTTVTDASHEPDEMGLLWAAAVWAENSFCDRVPNIFVDLSSFC